MTGQFSGLLFFLDNAKIYQEVLRRELCCGHAHGASARIVLVPRPHQFLTSYSASNALGMRYAMNLLKRESDAAEAVVREMIQTFPASVHGQMSVVVLNEDPSAERISGMALAAGSDRVVIGLKRSQHQLKTLEDGVRTRLLNHGHAATIISSGDIV